MSRYFALPVYGPSSAYICAEVVVACANHGINAMVRYIEPSGRVLGRINAYNSFWNDETEREFRDMIMHRAPRDLLRIAHAALKDELRYDVARAFLVFDPERDNQETIDITESFVKLLKPKRKRIGLTRK
jgi:hypothetical protein